MKRQVRARASCESGDFEIKDTPGTVWYRVREHVMLCPKHNVQVKVGFKTWRVEGATSPLARSKRDR